MSNHDSASPNVSSSTDSGVSPMDTDGSDTFMVVALYKFVSLPDFEKIQPELLDYCKEVGLKGTLLLAKEGINGTVSGTKPAIEKLLGYLRTDERLSDIEYKESFYNELPFHRMKVKLKREIVTMGVEDIDPRYSVGTYVDPKDWNALISDPDVTLIDTRNYYEVDIGTFEGAIDPKTTTFRELPGYIEENMSPKKQKKVAMFCTGGIRCEKSTAYMKQQGFDEVYHLKGGILKYLEDVPEDQSMWKGECFVFDNRVAVNHQLERGQYDQCFGCRHPITDEEKQSDKYLEGVACPRCYDQQTDEQRARFSERQKQMTLANERSELHIGAAPPKRQQAKQN